MSTLRIHGIEAKSDPTSASVNEKIKITNSNGDLLLHLDGTQAGIGTVGITTTGTTFHVDRATGEITFVTDAVFNGTVGIAGTLTYEDVTNVDSIGILTARGGIRIGGGTTVGPSSGIVTYFGDGSQLTGISAGAISAIGSDGAARVLTSDGDGTATAHSFVTIESNRLSVNRGSGSGAYPLIVRRTDASGIIAEFANSSGYGLLIGQNSATGEAYLRTGTGQPLVITTNAGSGIANARMTISSAGDITTPKQPIFATKINYVNSYVSSGTKIQMQAAHIDTRSGFSDANDRYTAPAAGRYLFYFFSNIDYNGDGTIAVRFHRNGSEFTSGEGGHIYSYAQNSGWHGLCGQIITNMAVNDYMEVFTSANNMKVDGNNYGQFGGYMIG